MSTNPSIRLSIPDRDSIGLNRKSARRQVMLKVENLSSEQTIGYKLRTSVSSLNLFMVSPKQGSICPLSTTMIMITCHNPGGIPPNGSQFQFCSNVFRDGDEMMTNNYQFQNCFTILRANINESVIQGEVHVGEKVQRWEKARLRMESVISKRSDLPNPLFSTPQRGAIVENPDFSENSISYPTTMGSNGDHTLNISTASTTTPPISPLYVTVREEESVLKMTPIHIAEEENKIENEKEKRNGSKNNPCLVALLVGTLVLLVHLAIFQILVWWEKLDFSSSSDNIIHSAFEEPSGFLGQIDLSLSSQNVGHFLWMFFTVVLLIAICYGKRFLAYPWFLMMIFSHLTTACTLQEIWHSEWRDCRPETANNNSFLFSREFVLCSTSTSSYFGPFMICASTLAFGSGAIYLAWREIKNW